VSLPSSTKFAGRIAASTSRNAAARNMAVRRTEAFRMRSFRLSFTKNCSQKTGSSYGYQLAPDDEWIID